MNASFVNEEEEGTVSIHQLDRKVLKEWTEKTGQNIDEYSDFNCLTFKIGSITIKLFT